MNKLYNVYKLCYLTIKRCFYFIILTLKHNGKASIVKQLKYIV